MTNQPAKLPVPESESPRRFSFGKAILALLTVFVGFFIVMAVVNTATRPPATTPQPLPAPSEISEEPSAPAPTPAPEPSPEPEPSPSPEVFYDDCAEVWANLERPIFAEDEGYRIGLDWDNDGIGCEDNPLTPEDESTIDWGSVRERFRENLEDLGDWLSPHLENLWSDSKDWAKTARDFLSR